MTADTSHLSPEDWRNLGHNLFTEYAKLLNIARQYAGPFLALDMCDDVTNTAALHLWKTVGRYRPDRDPTRAPLSRYFASAYAHTVVRNHALTAIRVAKLRAKRLAKAPEDVAAIAAPSAPHPIEVEEQRNADAEAVARALKMLDKRSAAIVTAVLLDPAAPLEEQRLKAEELFGQSIPQKVFSNAKTRALKRCRAVWPPRPAD